MVLRNASTMTHVAILQNPILREIRNAAAGVLSHIPALRQRLVEQLCELDLNYEKSPMTAGSHGLGQPAETNAAYPKPGHLLVRPDGYVAASSNADSGTDLVDHLRQLLGR